MDSESLTDALAFFSVGRALLALAVVVLTWLAVAALDALFGALATRLTRYRLAILRTLPVVRVVIWAGAVWFVIARVFQPERETLLAVVASIGIAVGLAAQDFVRNLISGLLILLDRPFQVGDMVSVGETRGEVVSIGLRSCRLRSFDDDLVTVPNAHVMSEEVSNSNAGSLQEMVVVPIMLPAHVDPVEATEIGGDAAGCSPYTDLSKPIAVVVEDVFDRTFLTRLRVKMYVLDVRLEKLIASDVTERVKRELIARGWIDEDIVRAQLQAG